MAESIPVVINQFQHNSEYVTSVISEHDLSVMLISHGACTAAHIHLHKIAQNLIFICILSASFILIEMMNTSNEVVCLREACSLAHKGC